MNIVKLNDDLTEIDGKVRVERGPARKTAKATDALLADAVTATHYQIGQRDADGKVIKADTTMAYLDWLAEKGFYVYALVALHPETSEGHWVEDSFHTDEAAAMARATEITAG